MLAASSDSKEMGRREQRLLYLLVVQRCQLVVLVELSFTSKEPELLLGCVGWRGWSSRFLEEELAGRETKSALGRVRVLGVMPG